MTDLPAGSVLAGYRIDGIAGHGGMGVVYRATDLTLDRAVAMKVIAVAIADDASFRKRFIDESRIAASLDHPNVVPIFHAGQHDGALFLVMRYVECDLRSDLGARGPLDVQRAARIVAQVASALDAAHARGLVHRDVKPANVLLSESDHAYLSDFGLSKRVHPGGDETKTGQLLGTLNYIAPEQIRGGTAEPRTDVYALGCVLFHTITGRVPFPLETDEAKLWAHISEQPPAPSSVVSSLPRALDEVLARAMAKDPSDRFASAGEFAEAALAAVGPPSVTATRGAISAEPASTRRTYNRALIANALRDPFNVVVLAAMVIAGILLNVLPIVGPAAVLVYLAGVARTYFDESQQSQVLVREREKRRREADTGKRRLDPDAFSPAIAELLHRALGREQRIREAIRHAKLPYSEVSGEVDRFLTTMRQTAARAEMLHDGLEDAPPDAIAKRLASLRESAPDKRELIDLLAHQLEVQQRMEAQLQRFYDQMEQVIVELDLVRGRVVTASASSETADQQQLAADVRGLRDDMGVVAAGMAAAYEQRDAVLET